MISPHLEEMDKNMDDVVFLKVDVDDCEDVAAKYNVSIELFGHTLEINDFSPEDHRDANIQVHQEWIRGC